MAWFGPTGSCGCCDPCPKQITCTNASGFSGLETTPRQITYVLENLPNTFYLRNPRYDSFYSSFLTLYYPFMEISNVQSLEGTYVIDLEEVPQDQVYACRYTTVSFTPSTTYTFNVVDVATGCPSLFIGRTVSNVNVSFTVTAYFDFFPTTPRLFTYAELKYTFTDANEGVLVGANSYTATITWQIPNYGNFGKLCGTTSGPLQRVINLRNNTYSVNGSEVTDCGAYGPQAADDSTWQFD